jgi:hypothetical protein
MKTSIEELKEWIIAICFDHFAINPFLDRLEELEDFETKKYASLLKEGLESKYSSVTEICINQESPSIRVYYYKEDRSDVDIKLFFSDKNILCLNYCNRKDVYYMEDYNGRRFYY